ncbi:MAG: hypothetical protein KKD17_04785 [Nanoarchaeota archaeon]|nr:hypothetical protein [Nanoarchaeota archaeon]
MQTNNVRATSEGIGRYLPREDWILEGMHLGRPRATCADPRDAVRIKALVPGYCRDDTPVFSMRDGEVYRMLGNVASVAADQSVREVSYDRSEISDIVAGSAEEPVVLGGDDIVDVLGENDPKEKTDRFNESAMFSSIFADRYELGLSIDYFKRTSRKGEVRHDFRYRRRQKEGVAGGWVSRGYVHEAVSALRQYDELVKSDNTSDLKKAAVIAVKYFTKEAKADAKSRIAKRYSEILVDKGDWQSLRKAKEVVNRHVKEGSREESLSVVEFCMEKEAIEISGWAASREVDYNTAVQAYAFLVKTGKPSNVMKAIGIAQVYVPQAVDATANYLQKIAWGLYDQNGRVVSADGKEEPTRQVKVIPQLPPHPSPPDMYADVPDSGVYRKGEYGAKVSDGVPMSSRSTPPPLPNAARIRRVQRPSPVPKLPPRPPLPRPILPVYGAAAMSA